MTEIEAYCFCDFVKWVAKKFKHVISEEEKGKTIRIRLCTKCLKRIRKDMIDGKKPFLQLKSVKTVKSVESVRSKEKEKKVRAAKKTS